MTRIVIALCAFLPLIWVKELEPQSFLVSIILVAVVISGLGLIRAGYDCFARTPYSLAQMAQKPADHRLLKHVVACVLLFLSLSVYSQYYASYHLSHRLPVECDGAIVQAYAQVTSPVNSQVSSMARANTSLIKHEFNATIKSIEHPLSLPNKKSSRCKYDRLKAIRGIKARYYAEAFASDGDSLAVAISDTPAHLPSDLISMTIELQSPRSLSAPLGFDAEKHALINRIDAYATIKELSSIDASPDKLSPMTRAKQRLTKSRLTIIAHADRNASSLEYYGVIRALIFADRALLADPQKSLFQLSGTYHLIAVSGLHLGICIAFVIFLFKGVVTLRYFRPNRLLISTLAMLGGCFYLWLADWPVSGQRALLMATIVLLFNAFGKQTPTYRIVLLAALIVLLADPLAILEGGFWLSFSAVLTLCVASRFYFSENNRSLVQSSQRAPMTRLATFLKTLLIAQLVLLVAMSVAQQTLGMGTTLLSIPANMIAIPLYSVVIVPLCLCGALFICFSVAFDNFAPFLDIAQLAFEIADFAIGEVNRYLLLLSNTKNHIAKSTLPITLSLLPVTVLCAALIVRSRYMAGWGALLTTMALLMLDPLKAGSVKLEADDVLLVQIDVGQGSAYLIKTRDASWLYDTGPSYQFGGDAASASVIPALTYYGVETLSGLIISHSDNDHAGGTKTVVSAMSPTQMLGPQEWVEPNKRDYCSGGLSPISLGGQLSFAVLWPNDFQTDQPKSAKMLNSSNDQSCVIAIQLAGRPNNLALIPGDISRAVELRLVEQIYQQLDSDLLALAHHGSNTSTGHSFLDAVEPTFAIGAMGYRNHYGHPSQKVVDRLSIRGIPFFKSPLTGTQHWIYRASLDQWEGPWCMRHRKRHFWQQHAEKGSCRYQIGE